MIPDVNDYIYQWPKNSENKNLQHWANWTSFPMSSSSLHHSPQWLNAWLLHSDQQDEWFPHWKQKIHLSYAQTQCINFDPSLDTDSKRIWSPRLVFSSLSFPAAHDWRYVIRNSWCAVLTMPMKRIPCSAKANSVFTEENALSANCRQDTI